MACLCLVPELRVFSVSLKDFVKSKENTGQILGVWSTKPNTVMIRFLIEVCPFLDYSLRGFHL